MFEIKVSKKCVKCGFMDVVDGACIHCGYGKIVTPVAPKKVKKALKKGKK